MAKYKVDYHKKSGRFFIKHKGFLCSHNVLGLLMKNVRDEFGQGSYSLTRAARKAHEESDRYIRPQ